MGLGVDASVTDRFKALKQSKGSIGVYSLKAEYAGHTRAIMIDKSYELDWNTFVEEILAGELERSCRYLLLRSVTMGLEPQSDQVYVVNWCAFGVEAPRTRGRRRLASRRLSRVFLRRSPDMASVKQRMLYAACKSELVRSLPGLGGNIHVHSRRRTFFCAMPVETRARLKCVASPGALCAPV